jgi:small subunit ribosomal protein S16
MVKIRIQIFGRKKLPFFRIVAVDSRKKRDSDSLSTIASYDPRNKNFKISEQQESVAIKRLNEGAQPTETARRLLIKNSKIIRSWFIEKNNKRKNYISKTKENTIKKI